MNFSTAYLPATEWSKMSKEAHLVAFGENVERDSDRADFALLIVDDNGDPAGYISCIEMGNQTVYWQYGGSMPTYRGSVFTWRGYRQCIEFFRPHYDWVITKISAQNKKMRHMAEKLGFELYGSETDTKGEVFGLYRLKLKGE